ncbi:uncharacterized protein LOC125657709 isoform X2 [Ostrea edulis]|nr:uncharacterized protein LOC125657709 isoform X2 [Ostrea edulis]
MRWENPCFQHTRTSSISLPPADIPLKDALQQLYRKANLQKEVAQVLMKRYIPTQGSRITNGFLIEYLKTANMEGLEFVEESSQSANCGNNISASLLNDYKHLSTLAVFLEKMVEDEMYFEHAELYDFMAPVQEKLYELMCDMHTTIYTVVNATISNHVTRDVMIDDLRGMSNERSSRFYRDYTIVNKDIEFLSQFSQKYLNISKSLS